MYWMAFPLTTELYCTVNTGLAIPVSATWQVSDMWHTQSGASITWDIVVGGWDLEYSAEFVPNEEGSYTIAVERARKVEASEEAIHNTFTSKESGKLVLSVDKSASRKKKVAAYRYFVQLNN
ncbi:hypothetical protein Ahy_B07g087461 isoform C [Arachis hypogaea]|uniref:GOLD domain-containing protein n=1 Tax=Arachis hypogaea TaxID=3818 RepID=A0A444YC76_ARAHY|nr:hypothetical protein Ahy_B07g087461 isoform C [Arachis hypogaea]